MVTISNKNNVEITPRRYQQRANQTEEAHAKSISNFAEAARILLRSCTQRHKGCNRNPGEISMPKRLVDLSNSSIRLVETKGMQFERYATLSYCWGTGKHAHELTTENFNEYHRSIPETTIPATLKDTARLVRQMGLRYVWIDALCIIQNDHEDWKIESGRMHTTYSCAYICISALYAISSDAGLSQGWIYPMKDVFPKAVEQHLLRQNLSFISEFKSFPLNQRGWTLQERFLSSRLLHIGMVDIWLECRESLVSFNSKNDCTYPQSIGSTGTFLGLEEFGEIVSQISGHSVPSESNILHSWYYLILEYCPRKLTKETDRLIAIDGIRKLYQSYMNCEYICGLWEYDIYNGLLWFHGGGIASDMSSCLLDPLSIDLYNETREDEPEPVSYHASTKLKKAIYRKLNRQHKLELDRDGFRSAQNSQTVWFGATPSWSWASICNPINLCYIDSEECFTFMGHTVPRLRMEVRESTHLIVQGIERACLGAIGTIAVARIKSACGITQLDYHVHENRTETIMKVRGRSNVFLDQAMDDESLECHAVLVYQSGFNTDGDYRSHHTLLLLENILESHFHNQSGRAVKGRTFKRIGMAFIESHFRRFFRRMHPRFEKRELFYLV